MKELSIEEKAKRYDDALERARNLPKDAENHQNINHPNGCIVMEDFNEGEGFYKVNLNYLNKKQVEEIEELVSKWKPTELQESEDEKIRKALLEYFGEECDTATINGIYCYKIIAWLEKQTPVKLNDEKDEKIRKELLESFKYQQRESRTDKEWLNGIKLSEVVSWLEKQGNKETKKVSIWKHWKDGIAGGEEGKQIYLIKSGLRYSISSCLGHECDYIELSELDELMREEKQGMPKWTEEDDAYKLFAISAVEDYYDEENPLRKDLVAWLKSIKQRIVP